MSLGTPDGQLIIENATVITNNINVQDRVGVATDYPQYNLDVHGTANVGTLFVSSITGDGGLLSNIASNLEEITVNGNVTTKTVEFINSNTSIVASGNIHASYFIGNGSFLSNVVNDNELESNVSILRSEMASNTLELRSDLQSNISTLRSEMASNTLELRTDLQSNVSTLRSEMASNTLELRTDLQSNVDILRGEMASNTLELRTDLQSNVSTLRSEMASNTLELRTDLQSNVDILRGEMASNTLELRTDLQSNVTVLRTDLQSNVSTLRSEMASNTLELRTDLQSNVDILRGEMASNTLELRTNLQSNVDILRGEMASNTLELRTDLQSNLSTLRGEMASNTLELRTDLQSNVGILRGEISRANTITFSNVMTGLIVDANVVVGGNVTATTFIGDGGFLSNIASNLEQIALNGNVTTQTLYLNNATTAFTTDLTSNVGVKLDQLSNVIITSPQTDHLLTYDGENWVNDFNIHNFIKVHNTTGDTLYKGNVVYIVDSFNNNVANVALAKADSASTMPGIGLIHEDILDGQEGSAVAYGKVSDINTLGFTEGQTVYVSNTSAGNIMNSKPYGLDDQIQNVGVCIRVHQSNGVVFVTGVGRSNDIPNAPISSSPNYVYVNETNNDMKKIAPENLLTKLQTLEQVVNTGNTVSNSIEITGNLTVSENVSIGGLSSSYIPFVGTGNYLEDSSIRKDNGNIIISADTEITGNLIVTGNSYIVSSNNVVIEDRILGLANNNPSHDLDTGIIMEHPGHNVALIHHGDEDRFSMGYTQNTVTDDHVLPDSNIFLLDILGNVTVQNNLTVGSGGSYFGDGTTLTGVALETDLTDNVTRIGVLETDLTDNVTRIGVLETDLTDNVTRIGVLETDLTDNVTRIGVLETDLTDNTSRIDVLETDLTDNASRIDVLETDLTDNVTRIGVLETDLTDNATRIGVLEIDLTDNASRIDVLETDLTDNASRIDVLETDLTDNVTRIGVLETDLTDNASRIDVLETDLTDNASRIDVLETDLTDNVTRIGVLETDLTDNASRIDVLETDLTDNASRIDVLETDLTDNASRIDVLETDLTDNASRIDVLETDLTDNASRIDVLETDLTDNASRIDVLETDLTDNASRIDVLETDLTDNASRIDVLETDLTDNVTRIGVLETDLTDNASRIDVLETDLTDNVTRIGVLETDLTDNASRIDVLETDLTDNASRIDVLETDLTDNASRIDVLETDLTDNVTRIGVLETDLTDNASRIDVLETDLTDNASRIDVLETDLTDNASRIDVLETDLTDNASRIDVLETDLTDNASRIDVLETDLTDNASRIDVLETDLTDNVTRIGVLETDLTDNASRIDVLETDLTDNASRIDVLETDLTDNVTRIGVLETDLTDNASRIDVLETDLTDNVTRIGVLETDLTDNASRIDVLETDLSDNSSRITSIESGSYTFTGIKTFENDVILESNLRINGDLMVANTINMIVSDPIMELGANNLNTGDLGIVMTRHGVSESNVAIVYDESQDIFRVGYTSNSAYESTIEIDDASAITMNVHGNVEAAYFKGDGSQLTGVGIDTTQTLTLSNVTTGLIVDSNVVVSGNVTAGSFIGDGSQLTGVATTLNNITEVDSNVGISNTNPQHTLAVGSNLWIEDTGSNVLTVEGNVAANYFIGDGSQLTGVAASLNNITEVDSNVGISNTNPQHTLAVGSNLWVEDAGSNVLTVLGNVAAVNMTLDSITLATGHALDYVTSVGNTTSNTVQFTNPATGFVTTSNVGIANVNPIHTLDVGSNLWIDETSSNVLYVDGNVWSKNITVGSNLYVEDTNSNVVTIEGNVSAHNLWLGSVEITPSYTLEEVTGEGNTTTQVIQFLDSNVGTVSSGGIVINKYAFACKHYAYSNVSVPIDFANVVMTFSSNVFHAKITAQLTHGNEEVSTMILDVQGGTRDGATSSLNIATGPGSVFGNTNTKPWNGTVSTTPTQVILEPSATGTTAYGVDLYVEYKSSSSEGKLESISIGNDSVKSFVY